ncbi:MAG TPA: hypothetical protein ACFYD6_09740 [Candidatus Brocadiia bacterium]
MLNQVQQDILVVYEIEIFNILGKPQYPRSPLCAYKLSMSNLTYSAYKIDHPTPYNAICVLSPASPTSSRCHYQHSEESIHRGMFTFILDEHIHDKVGTQGVPVPHLGHIDIVIVGCHLNVSTHRRAETTGAESRKFDCVRAGTSSGDSDCTS